MLIAASQYAFQLRFSDTNDFLFYTLGTATRTCMAAWADPRAHWL